jgi:hypothetical protein
MDVVTVNLTCTNVVEKASTTTTHAMMMVVQEMT